MSPRSMTGTTQSLQSSCSSSESSSQQMSSSQTNLRSHRSHFAISSSSFILKSPHSKHCHLSCMSIQSAPQCGHFGDLSSHGIAVRVVCRVSSEAGLFLPFLSSRIVAPCFDLSLFSLFLLSRSARCRAALDILVMRSTFYDGIVLRKSRQQNLCLERYSINEGMVQNLQPHWSPTAIPLFIEVANKPLTCHEQPVRRIHCLQNKTEIK